MTNLGSELVFFINRINNSAVNAHSQADIHKPHSVNNNISMLINQTQKSIEYFEEIGINDEIKNATTDFLCFLKQNTNAAIANGKPLKATNQAVFGRKIVMNIFCDKLEKPLKEAFPPNCLGHSILFNANLWPLKNGLLNSKNTLKQINNTLKQEIDYSEEKIFGADDQFISRQERITVCETMALIWEILTAINNYLPVTEITWCKNCFRQTEQNLLFCRLHIPKHSNDTAYRKANRIKNCIPPETTKNFSRYKNLRLNLGDNPRFIDEVDSISITANQNSYLITDKKEHAFFIKTINEHWKYSKTPWIHSIKSQLPYVSSAINNTNYSCSKDWEQFVKCLFLGLQEPNEKCTHPFWIKKILENAETWFTYEASFSDRRKTATAKEILKLYKQGMKQSEIVKIVKKSRQYVSKVIKTRTY